MTRTDMFRRKREEAEGEAREIVEEIKEIAGIGDDRNSVSNMCKGILKDLSTAPVPKQIGVGAAVGWVSGYVTMKVGKMAATAIGGSLLLLQIAHYKGYIKVNNLDDSVNWNRLSNDSSSIADRVRDRLQIKSRSTMDKVADFAKQNVYLAGGFTGGFFLGIASS